MIAEFWEIIDGNREQWKPRHVLWEDLFDKWSTIDDKKIYSLEVSIAFDMPLGREPDPNKQGGQKRLERYRELQIERDDKLIARENHFDTFINKYGERTSDLVHLEDSFACAVQISGKGLKDLVFNYPYVFEVSEKEQIVDIFSETQEDLYFELEIIPPDEGSPEVGVIDSGIMENNKYLSLAIRQANSKCYVPGQNSTTDNVRGGGHGTKVAGAILYPMGVTSLTSPYQL